MKLRKLSNSPAVVLLVFILLGVVSCSDEEQVVSNVASPSDFINFSVAENNQTHTRTAFDSQNYVKKLKNFYVYAFLDDPEEEEPYMDNVEIVNQGNGKFSYKDENKRKRWLEDESLHFVAVNSPNNFGSRPEIDVWSNHEVSLGVYSGGNEDYMAAFESDEYKQANHGTVKLQFHHLLSQIKFGISNMSNKLEIMDIKQIGLKGVYHEAEFTMLGNGAVQTRMARDYLGLGEYSFEIENFEKADKSYLNASKDIFIVPLNHQPWNPKSGVKIADINKAIGENDAQNVYSYVWVKCKIYDHSTGQYVVGDYNSYGVTYFPFKADLKAGKRYKYTITITDDFIGYPDQNTTLQEPKLGWVISDAGNIFSTCEEADNAGEKPVAMIAYISDNGNGPAPYSKHGLAISLRNLKSPDRTNLFLIEELEKVDTYLSEYQKVAPSWTRWYVPRFKDFDLIFDAFGGTKYSNKPHYTTQPWDYGRLNDFMESTERYGEDEVYHDCFIGYLPPYYDWQPSRYWINVSENSQSSFLWLYDIKGKQYLQWHRTALGGCFIRPVFKF